MLETGKLTISTDLVKPRVSLPLQTYEAFGRAVLCLFTLLLLPGGAIPHSAHYFTFLLVRVMPAYVNVRLVMPPAASFVQTISAWAALRKNSVGERGNNSNCG